MPHITVPALPSVVTDPSYSQKQKQSSALTRAAKEGRLLKPTGDPLEDALRRLRYRLATGAPPRTDEVAKLAEEIRTIRTQQRRTGILGLLEAVAKPFDVATEAVAGVVGGVVPQEGFRARSKASRAVIRSLFTDEVDLADASEVLREIMQSRSGVEQFITGVLFDPLNFIPGGLLAKGIVKTGLPGAKAAAAVTKAVVGPPIPTPSFNPKQAVERLRGRLNADPTLTQKISKQMMGFGGSGEEEVGAAVDQAIKTLYSKDKPKELIEYLAATEVEPLIRAAEGNPLHNAVIRLTFDTAAREGEIGLVRAGDVDWANREIRFHSIGRKAARTVTIHSQETLDALRAVFPEGTPPITPLLPITKPKKGVVEGGAEAYNAVLSELGEKAGFGPLRGNVVRKAAATAFARTLLASGQSFEMVSELLGHEIAHSAHVAGRDYIKLSEDLRQYDKFVNDDLTFKPLPRGTAEEAAAKVAEGEAAAAARTIFGGKGRAKGRVSIPQAARLTVSRRQGEAILAGVELDPEYVRIITTLGEKGREEVEAAFRAIVVGSELGELTRIREVIRNARDNLPVKERGPLSALHAAMTKEIGFAAGGIRRAQEKTTGRALGRIKKALTGEPRAAEYINALELAHLRARDVVRGTGAYKRTAAKFNAKRMATLGLSPSSLRSHPIMEDVETMASEKAAEVVGAWWKEVERLFGEAGFTETKKLRDAKGKLVGTEVTWVATYSTAVNQLRRLADSGGDVKLIFGSDFRRLWEDLEGGGRQIATKRLQVIATQALGLGVIKEPAVVDAPMKAAARPKTSRFFEQGGVGGVPPGGAIPPAPSVGGVPSGDLDARAARFVSDKATQAEIQEIGVKPSGFAQRLSQGKQGPEWLWSQDWVAALERRVARLGEVVWLRGASALGVSKLFLARNELVRQGVDEATNARSILHNHPGWAALRRLADDPKLPQGYKLPVKKILPELAEAISGRPDITTDQVMQHFITIFQTIPINRLDEFYDLTPEIKEAIILTRKWVSRATDVTVRRGVKIDEVLKSVTKGKGADPNYFPRVPADLALSGEERVAVRQGLRGPGAALSAERRKLLETAFWKKTREIPTAAEALKNGVKYRNPLEAAFLYVGDVQRYGADLELVRRLDVEGYTETFARYAARSKTAQSLVRLWKYKTATPAEAVALDPKDVKRLLEDVRGSEDTVLGEWGQLGERILKAPPDEARALKDDVLKIAAAAQEAEDAATNLKTLTKGLSGLDGVLFRDAADAARANVFWKEGHKQWLSLFRSVNRASTMLRFMKAGVDLSTMFIHGLPMIASGRVNEWARATYAMGRAIADPRIAAEYMERNLDVANEFMRHGGVVTFSEPLEGAQDVSTLLRERGGRVGRGMAVVTEGAERAFTTWQNVARVELWGALRHQAKSPDDLQRLAAHVNKMTGVYNTALAGMPELQRYIEGSMISFAPMYRRAAFGLLTSIFTGEGLEKKLAMQAVLKMMGSLTLMFGVLPQFTGNNERALNPSSPQFMAWRMGDSFVGVGSAYYSLVRTATAMVEQLATPEGREALRFRPADFNDVALLRWWRSQAPPIAASALDLMFGETYIGDPLRGADGNLDYNSAFKWAATRTVPMMVESVIEGGVDPMKAGLSLSGVGARTFPVSVFVERAIARNNALLGETDPEIAAWRRTQDDPTYADMPQLLKNILTRRHPELQELDKAADAQKARTGTPTERLYLQFRKELDTNRRVIDSQRNGISKLFASGQINSQEFRKRVAQMGVALAQMQRATRNRPEYAEVVVGLEEAKIRRSTAAKETSAFIGDFVFDQYFEMVVDNPDTVNEDGVFMPERYEAARQVFLQRYPQWVGYVERRLKEGRQGSDLIDEYNEAKVALREYWDLAATLWKRGSDDWELVSQYRQKETRDQRLFKQRYPRLNYLLPRLEDVQERYQRTHPEQDWLLVKFYGNIPRTLDAQRRLETWRETQARLLTS